MSMLAHYFRKKIYHFYLELFGPSVHQKNKQTNKIKVLNFLHSALLFMTAISTVLYLRLSLDDRHSSPYPPNRKMAGILSYELGKLTLFSILISTKLFTGYLVWDPSPTNESSRIPPGT